VVEIASGVRASSAPQGQALLLAGQSFVARVLAESDGTLLRLMSAQGPLTLPVSKVLSPGTQVRIDVANGPQGPAVTVTVLPGTAPQAGGQAAASQGWSGAATTLSQRLSQDQTSQLAARSVQGQAPASTLSSALQPSVSQPTGRTNTVANALPPSAAASIQNSQPQQTDRATAQALAQALQGHSMRGQAALAPALATIAAVAASQESDMPQPVRLAAGEVLQRLMPLDKPLTPDALRSQIQQSGVFREGQIAAGLPVGLDLKTALLDLTRTLGVIPRRMVDDTLERPNVPRRGATPSAQGALAIPEISASAATGSELLKSAAEGALDRLRLLQLASRPERAEIGAPAPAQGQVQLELPYRLGEQVGVVSMLIEPDPDEEDRQRSGAGKGRTWRLSFALDVEPLGPVHGEVRVRGLETTVGLWAERPETTRAFLDATSELKSALSEASLEVGDVSMRRGSPPQRASALQHLDRQA
jgi:hypothetical protein